MRFFNRTGVSLALLVMTGSLVSRQGSAQVLYASDVFVGGQEGPLGTPNYRIPGMIVTGNGTLLAFTEGRRGASDPGAPNPIDLFMKRSTDGGRIWSPLTIIDRDSLADFANPTPMYDAVTNTAFIVYDQFPDRCGSNEDCVQPGNDPDPTSKNQVVWYRTSADHGVTWSPRTQILKPVKSADGMSWNSGAVGPGSGIQLRWQKNTAHNGRLIIPARRRAAEKAGGPLSALEPFVYYSDDHGQTWHVSAVTPGPSGNESEVAELTDGTLLFDARQDTGTVRRRHVSTDGGVSWGPDLAGDPIITPVDASLVRYSAKRDGHDADRVLFSAPSGDPPGSGNGRRNISVWISYDEGRTYPVRTVVAGDHGGYSVLAKLPNGVIGLLYEATGSTIIRFVALDLAALEKQ